MITVYLISTFFLLISGIKTPTTFLVCSNYVFKLFEPESEILFTQREDFLFTSPLLVMLNFIGLLKKVKRLNNDVFTILDK